MTFTKTKDGDYKVFFCGRHNPKYSTGTATQAFLDRCNSHYHYPSCGHCRVNGNFYPILTDVSFKIPSGTFVFIIGDEEPIEE